MYLYLTEPDWAKAWIFGGEVPFYVASRYKREERAGIYTPDENLIDTSTFDIKNYQHLISVAEGVTVKGLQFIDSKLNGVPVNGTLNRSYEDGLVICMATKRSKYIARRLGKKVCVRVDDVNKLKECVDFHTGIKGVGKVCEYTASHERNHFLKSTYDSWQREYRLFWLGVGNITVELPPRLGIHEFTLP